MGRRWLGGALILALLVAPLAGRAAEPEDRYLQIYGLIETADSLSRSNQNDSAKVKYREAHAALLELRRDHPKWNTRVVAYRLNYVGGKLTALAQPITAPAEPAGATKTGDTKPQVKPATLPANMQMRLLDAGAEPHRELRFRTKAGDKQTVAQTTKATMGMGDGTAPAQMMKMPAMTMTLTVMTRGVSASGDINYEAHIEDVGVSAGPESTPELVEAMKASTRGIKGVVVDCTLSDRGFNKKTAVRIPPGTDAELRASMEAVKEEFEDTEFVLPHEPIGVGARWEVKQKIKSEGITMDQTTTHELISIEGDILTAKSSTAQQAARQKVPNPMVPQSQADLIKLAGTGSASLTIDLTKLLPTHATVEDHTEMTLTMDVAGQKQTLTLKTDSTSHLEAKQAGDSIPAATP